MQLDNPPAMPAILSASSAASRINFCPPISLPLVQPAQYRRMISKKCPVGRARPHLWFMHDFFLHGRPAPVDRADGGLRFMAFVVEIRYRKVRYRPIDQHIGQQGRSLCLHGSTHSQIRLDTDSPSPLVT